MNSFVPVKITKKKYADRLIQGEVFMRALHEFGSWGDISQKDDVLKNDYRGDLYSGVTAVFANPADCGYFAKLAKKSENRIDNCCLIDESDIQYFKILSLYCYEYDDEKQAFIRPDPRMAQFGDTAVIITDFREFLDRFARALFSNYAKLTAMIDRVKPFDFHESQWLNPLFCKHVSQAYQNELRLAFGELEKNVFVIGQSDANSMIMNWDPVTLRIGSIEDITVEMPIEAFMGGCLPDDFKCIWPENERPAPLSNFERVRAATIEQMREYRSIHIRPVYTALRDGKPELHSGEIMPFVEFLRQCED